MRERINAGIQGLVWRSQTPPSIICPVGGEVCGGGQIRQIIGDSARRVEVAFGP